MFTFITIFIVLYYVFLFIELIINNYTHITFNSKTAKANYEKKKETIQKEMIELNKQNEQIISSRKEKGNSFNDPGENLFGKDKKQYKKAKKINLKPFTEILELDKKNLTIDVEASTTFDKVIKFLERRNYQPVFTVDMYHISIGGLIGGVGGGSSCAKNGAFHDSVLDMDVLTSDGKIYHCSPTENKNLFYSVANAYGSLGYILRLKLKIVKMEKYVKVKNLYFKNRKDYFNKIKELQSEKMKPTYDFLEGTIFNNKHLVLMVGKYTNTYKGTLLNTVNHKVYWRELRDVKPSVHYMTVDDYNWRWDVDGYYTTIDMGWFFNNELLRPLMPRFLMNGRFLRPFAENYLGVDYKDGNMVNDVLFPTEKSSEALEWYDKEIGLYPMYICPICASNKSYLFNIPGDYVDFGIGYGVTADTTEESIIWKKKLEKKMLEYKGVKLLYCKQWLKENDFWNVYSNIDEFKKNNESMKDKEMSGKDVYDYLKKQYDPGNKFPSLYDKVS